jgi:hypothetical protein
VLNIAEGAGQRSRPQKRRFYAIARGSAMECAAVLDVLRLSAVASGTEARRGAAPTPRTLAAISILRIDARLSPAIVSARNSTSHSLRFTTERPSQEGS